MLDSAGFFLSLANRLLMKSSMPTHGQIALWDQVFVRVSTMLDPILGFRFGKSILMIWQRTENDVSAQALGAANDAHAAVEWIERR